MVLCVGICDSLNDTETRDLLRSPGGWCSEVPFCGGLLGPQSLQQNDQRAFPSREEWGLFLSHLNLGVARRLLCPGATLSHMTHRRGKHVSAGACSRALFGTLKPLYEQARASWLADDSHAEENQGSQATNLLSATQLSGHILDRSGPGQPQTQGKSQPSVTAPLFPVLRSSLRRLCLWSVLEVTGDYVHTYCLRQSQRRWPRGQQHCELQPGEAKSQGDTCW